MKITRWRVNQPNKVLRHASSLITLMVEFRSSDWTGGFFCPVHYQAQKSFFSVSITRRKKLIIAVDFKITFCDSDKYREKTFTLASHVQHLFDND